MKLRRKEQSPEESSAVSLRRMRMQALAPRIAFYAVVAVLVIAGLRSAFAPAAGPAPVVPTSANRSGDVGAWSFAEAFARVYLSWEADEEGERERQLAAFLPSDLEDDAGLIPADGSSQQVLWTAITGVQAEGEMTNVVVAARTSEETLQLSVPVRRDDRGFLYVSGYPAIVGPPVVDETASPPSERAVEDSKLETVVERAIGNYLTRSSTNLLADLMPDAVISLPGEALAVVGFGDVTWVTPMRRVAAEVRVEDPRGTVLALRYELDVLERDRWYVSSIQVDPTFKGGS